MPMILGGDDDDLLHIIEEDPESLTSSHNSQYHGNSQDDQQQPGGSSSADTPPKVEIRRRVRARTNNRLEEDDFVFIEAAENEVEAQKMEQNYMFGFKPWKSHVTRRPLDERSEIVQELYKPPKEVKYTSYPSLTVSNILYTLLFGWIMALVYALVGSLMFLTVIAWKHGKFCFILARYFLWPFGYFVQEQTEYIPKVGSMSRSQSDVVVNSLHDNQGSGSSSSLAKSQSTAAFDREHSRTFERIDNSRYWKRPSTYVWLILGVPFVCLLHAIIFFTTWMSIFFLPIAKLNMMAIRRLILLPPEKLRVSKTTAIKPGERSHEVIMCSYQAANIYSYKYTVDGMNIVFVNMIPLVIIAIVIGFVDHTYTSPAGRFVMGLVAIIPLAHYIGMAIASISAQSNHVVGAVLNATFGSIVEIILYISSLLKQSKDLQKESGICYSEIVKSALTGTLLATLLFIPGVCMMVGGLKHKEQRFNVRSVSVSSTLLFISVVGVFTPTIFTITFGNFECHQCFNQTQGLDNVSEALRCIGCTYVYKLDGGSEDFLNKRLSPLVYVCVALLFLAYVIGLIFSLKTHTHIIQGGNIDSHSKEKSQHKVDVHWGRIKSTFILVVAVVLMSLSAEVVVQNLDPILANSTVITPVFMGVSVLALVPDLPEIINGIQFALKNNINLSLEIGCSVAVQVCLLQIPVIVLVDAIHDLHFNLVFNDLHLWSVIISVIIINYIFVDGKSDYFQGCMLCIIYLFLLAMFFFAGNSPKNDCVILK